MSISIDANVLVYAMDRNDPEKRLIAEDLVRLCVQSDTFVITEQTLWEFANASTRRRLLSRSDAIAAVESWSQLMPVAMPGQPTVADVCKLLGSYHLQIWDARLLATCGACGVTVLFSEDMQDGGQYGPVRVLNPFNPANDRTIGELLK